MIIQETVEMLKGFRLYASKGDVSRVYCPAGPGNKTYHGSTYLCDDSLSIGLCEPLENGQSKRVLSIDFETGVVRYEISSQEQSYILKQKVTEWCRSMAGGLSAGKAHEKLWNACESLGLTKDGK